LISRGGVSKGPKSEFAKGYVTWLQFDGLSIDEMSEFEIGGWRKYQSILVIEWALGAQAGDSTDPGLGIYDRGSLG
jgi:hypothetical protein